MEFVKLESRDKLRIMTISRESVLNALNRQVLEEISHVVELLENDDEAEVLIITGTGTSPVKRIQQISLILLCYPVILSSLLKKNIQVLPIYRSYPCCIPRLLHPALYLKRSNTSLQNLRKNLYRRNIFQTQRT